MVISFANDWRGGSFNMGDLIRNLYDTPEGRNMSDVTFVLDDGTKLHAHKLILITACPHFEAIFHRPMENNQEPVQEIKIEDVQADVFRIMLKTIYNSGRYSEVKEQDDADKLIPIMEAANRYLLPNLVAILAKEVTECAEAGDWDKLLQTNFQPIWVGGSFRTGSILVWVILQGPANLGWWFLPHWKHPCLGDFTR